MSDRVDPIWEATEMEGLDPLKQAAKAIAHVLDRVISDNRFAYYVGPGSQSWALLTEAYANIHNRPVPEVREGFHNPNAEKVSASEATIPLIESCIEDYLTSDDVLNFIDGASVHTRVDLLDQIQERYCLQCGGVRIVKIGPCGCNLNRR